MLTMSPNRRVAVPSAVAGAADGVEDQLVERVGDAVARDPALIVQDGLAGDEDGGAGSGRRRMGSDGHHSPISAAGVETRTDEAQIVDGRWTATDPGARPTATRPGRPPPRATELGRPLGSVARAPGLAGRHGPGRLPPTPSAASMRSAMRAPVKPISRCRSLGVPWVT